MNLKNWKSTFCITSVFIASSTMSLIEPSLAHENYIAQSNNCREVNVDTSLNVRTKPNGAIVRQLDNADRVYIVDTPVNGWVKIRYPVEGYIYAQYLAYCSHESSSINNENNRVTTETLAQPVGENISTFPASNCRQVNRSNLLVRDKPNGQIVGQLSQDQQVILSNEGYNGWVPIEKPINGYISAQYLTKCETASTNLTPVNQESVATVNGSNCRQVMSPNVPIRSEPMGKIIGTLTQNEQVYIANEGYDGWVPVEQPVNGYVTSANLGNCTP